MPRMLTRVLLTGLLLVPFSLPAFAASANFQGKCSYTGSNLGCSFDTARPAGSPSACPGSYILIAFWDFGDGGTASDGGGGVVNHTYTAPIAGSYTVHLTITCGDGTHADRYRQVCPSWGTPGCIQVTGAWN